SVAAIHNEVGATDRVLCPNIGFLFGHPNGFPFPAECLTVPPDTSTQAQLPGALHPNHQIPDRAQLPTRRRDAFHDDGPARRDILPIAEPITIPVVSLEAGRALGE